MDTQLIDTTNQAEIIQTLSEKLLAGHFFPEMVLKSSTKCNSDFIRLP